MEERSKQRPELVDSLRRLLRTLASIIANRVELLACELQEERQRLVIALLLLALAWLLALMTLILLSATILILFWDHRIPAVLILLGLHLGGTLFTAWQLRRRLRAWKPFTATIEELRKDVSCLRPRA